MGNTSYLHIGSLGNHIQEKMHHTSQVISSKVFIHSSSGYKLIHHMNYYIFMSWVPTWFLNELGDQSKPGAQVILGSNKRPRLRVVYGLGGILKSDFSID